MADFAESRKEDLYCHLQRTHIFVPIAVETTGPFGTRSMRFLKDLAGYLCSNLGNALSFQYLFSNCQSLYREGMLRQFEVHCYVTLT